MAENIKKMEEFKMANTILIKRGLIKNLSNLTLAEGELALAFNDEKTKIALYAGTGEENVLLNPDVTVPTKVSELTNDSKFQTESEVATAVATAIAATGHASFKKISSIPTAETAEDNVLYLVMNDKTKHYDIYAKVDSEVVLLDDTTVDLSGYATVEELNKKVDKVDGKQLSTEDYTTAEKEKLAGLSNYTHPTSHPASMITQDSTHRFVSDAEKTAWNSKLDSTSTIDGGTF